MVSDMYIQQQQSQRFGVDIYNHNDRSEKRNKCIQKKKNIKRKITINI